MDALLQNIMDAGHANALLVIRASDLTNFADYLVEQTRRIVEAEYKDQYFTVKELASTLHVTPTTIYNMARLGKLKPVKVGKRTVFSRTAVNDAISRGLLGKYMHKY